MSNVETINGDTIISRLETIRYLEHCGNPPDHDWAVPKVRDFQSAFYGYAIDRGFRPFQMQRINEISNWVREHIDLDPDEYLFQQREQIDPVITAIIKRRIWPMLPSQIQRADSNAKFMVRTGFKADLMHMVIEFRLIDQGMPPVFFTQLLAPYEAGRYPCGWEGAFPHGRLIVF